MEQSSELIAEVMRKLQLETEPNEEVLGGDQKGVEHIEEENTGSEVEEESEAVADELVDEWRQTNPSGQKNLNLF